MTVESVWDYPRPPRVELSSANVVVEFHGVRVVDTTRSLRVLETSHPPVHYVPFADVLPGVLEVVPGRWTSCEFKGRARYWTVSVGDRRAEAAAWDYPSPSPDFEVLRDHVAFYPGRMDRCLLDGEIVSPQEGDFYGGWITSRVVGPFKGGPGTRGW